MSGGSLTQVLAQFQHNSFRKNLRLEIDFCERKIGHMAAQTVAARSANAN
jgi:hypothetical protein